MATTTSEVPPPHDYHACASLGATELSRCILCASSKATKIMTVVAEMQPQSGGLFSVPLELRVMIYSYVFAAKEPASLTNRMTIIEAQNVEPKSALLLACQEIFREASAAFEVARTEFWTNNTLHVRLTQTHPVPFGPWVSTECLRRQMNSISGLHDRELEHIKEVIVAVKLTRDGMGDPKRMF